MAPILKNDPWNTNQQKPQSLKITKALNQSKWYIDHLSCKAFANVRFTIICKSECLSGNWLISGTNWPYRVPMHYWCVVRREQKENRCRAHHRAAVFGDKACWRGASLCHHPPFQSHQLPSYGWTCWMTSQNPAEEIRQSKTGSQLRSGPFPAQSYEKSISPWVYLILSKRGMAHLLAQLRQSHACLDHRSLVYHYQSRIFKWAKNNNF